MLALEASKAREEVAVAPGAPHIIELTIFAESSWRLP